MPILITKWLLCSQNDERKLAAERPAKLVLVWKVRFSTQSVGSLTYTVLESGVLITYFGNCFFNIIILNMLQIILSYIVSTHIFIIINFISSRSSFSPYVIRARKVSLTISEAFSWATSRLAFISNINYHNYCTMFHVIRSHLHF